MDALIERCIKKGLGLIAITDHNSIEGALYAKLNSPFPVIIGEEITTSDGEITGLFLQEVVPRGLSASETIKHIKDQGGLVSIPHPFDTFRRNVISKSVIPEIMKNVIDNMGISYYEIAISHNHSAAPDFTVSSRIRYFYRRLLNG